MHIRLENVSTQIARIDIADPAGGEFDIPQGEAIFLAPGDHRELSWARVITPEDVQTPSPDNAPTVEFMRAIVWVRDIGMNIRDIYQFAADMRHFTPDGSRIRVDPRPAFPWITNVAGPTGPRIYERLAAGLEGTTPAS